MNQDAGYYVALVIFEKQQDVKVVQIWINLSGLIAALLKPVANPKECDSFVCPLLHTFAYDMEQSDNGMRIEQCKKWSKNDSVE